MLKMNFIILQWHCIHQQPSNLSLSLCLVSPSLTGLVGPDTGTPLTKKQGHSLRLRRNVSGFTFHMQMCDLRAL